MIGTAGSASAYTINTTELGKRIRWASDSVTLQLDPALEAKMPAGDAFAALEIGLDAWRGLPNVPELVLRSGAPAYEPGNHGKRPTNGVYLLEDWPYEADKLAITVITYEMETGRLLDADVLVNGETAFALLDEQGPQAEKMPYDLPAVLTHEIGHLLGLGESDADPGATMWPYAKPGETQKRTLAQDDEDGVIASYLSKAPAPASGCGAMSIAGRVRTRGPLPLALLALGVVVLGAGRKRRLHALALSLPLTAALLVGFGEPVAVANPAERMRERVRTLEDLASDGARAALLDAVRSEDSRARLEAVETLARVGTRDERRLAERLASDDDAQVAARAREALGAVLARAPRALELAQSPAARARLAQLFGRGDRWVRGRAQRVGTVMQAGLLRTEYRVRGEDGGEVTLRVLGGSLDGVGQRVLDAEPIPADDQELVVVPQPDGHSRWAYAQQGVVFGGDLGDGAAIAY